MRPGRIAAGFSLLELLVASFLGLAVVSLVLAQWLSLARSQGLRAARAQMQEDAVIAMDLLRADFLMLGHGQVRALARAPGTGEPTWQTGLQGPALLACDEGFATLPEMAAPSCASAVSGRSSASSAVEIAYEADADSTLTGSDGRPTDCLGNALSALELANAGRTFIAYNRWQVSQSGSRSELRCSGRGRTGPQPLVDNIEHLILRWGLPVDAQGGSALRYLPAAQVADFSAVWAVRICLLVRSREPVLGAEDVRTYRDCTGAQATSADGRLRRAVWSTVAFRSGHF